jgi:hypothetical protein
LLPISLEFAELLQFGIVCIKIESINIELKFTWEVLKCATIVGDSPGHFSSASVSPAKFAALTACVATVIKHFSQVLEELGSK